MTINKSTVFKMAWTRVKEDNMSMSEALKKAWSLHKNLIAKLNNIKPESKKDNTAIELKNDFWSAWKSLKSAYYSDSKKRAEDIFNSVCNDIHDLLSEDQIKNTFGKYADFVISKTA